ncbi:MAG: tetratricopeptide repeat protein [Desulfosporosinus sp.]|nr:tetratricopeptide repeat protein [Desulfosporosinus sp.]
MNGKWHRRFAVILVAIICIAMVVSGGSMFFSGSGLPSTNSNTSTNAPNSVADYQAQKVRIAAIAEQAKADPGNIPLQNDLGNEYYDAGVAAQSVAPTEAQGNFRQAVEAYQNVLKTNKDPNVMVDMATAAFKSGNNDLAEKSFQEALTLKPDFYNGLVNYGVFLANAKQDLAGAITQWQKAQKFAPDSSAKAQLATMISQAQSQLQAPINKGTSNPATPGK